MRKLMAAVTALAVLMLGGCSDNSAVQAEVTMGTTLPLLTRLTAE